MPDGEQDRPLLLYQVEDSLLSSSERTACHYGLDSSRSIGGRMLDNGERLLERNQTTNPFHPIEISVVRKDLTDSILLHDNGCDHVGKAQLAIVGGIG
jgi:hypothetical protein